MKWNIISSSSVTDTSTNKKLFCSFHPGLQLVDVQGILRCPHCGIAYREDEAKHDTEIRSRYPKSKTTVIQAKKKRILRDSLGNPVPDDMAAGIKGTERVTHYSEYIG